MRKRKLIFLSIAAVAISTALLIVVASLFGGFIDAVDGVTRDIFGDIYLRPGLQIPDCNQLLDSLEQLEEVQAATAVLNTYGLLRLETGDVRAVWILGIEPTRHTKVTSLKEHLLIQKHKNSPASFVPANDSNTIGGFVSIGLLAKPDEKTDEYDIEKVKEQWLGKDVVLTTGVVSSGKNTNAPEAAKQLKARYLKFTISDIFFAGMYFLDNLYIYLPIDQLRNLIASGDAENSGLNEAIQIKVAEGVEPQAAIESVRKVWEEFGYRHNLPEYYISGPLLKTYKQLGEDFVAEIRKQMAVSMLVFGVICSVGILLIFCIFYMIVMTKQKDIAIIKSCGSTSWAVASIFIGFGGCVGVIGAAFGTFLGYIVTKNINILEGWIRIIFGLKLWKSSAYMFSKIPNEVNFQATCWIVIFVILSAVIGALVPAIVAARTRPVNILRYE